MLTAPSGVLLKAGYNVNSRELVKVVLDLIMAQFVYPTDSRP